MTILGSSDIEQFRDIKIAYTGMINGITKKHYEALMRVEDGLPQQGIQYGLPAYVALLHHVYGRSLRSIAQEWGVFHQELTILLESCAIPRLTRYEAIARENQRRWEDPSFKERNTDAVRQSNRRRGEPKPYNFNGVHTLPDVDYYEGDKIVHARFGVGRVISSDLSNHPDMNGYNFTVRFSDGEEKCLIVSKPRSSFLSK
jgi:hypothetical protein